jgi:hypothetical protein
MNQAHNEKMISYFKDRVFLLQGKMKEIEEGMKKISVEIYFGRIDAQDGFAEMQVHDFDLGSIREEIAYCKDSILEYQFAEYA